MKVVEKHRRYSLVDNIDISFFIAGLVIGESHHVF